MSATRTGEAGTMWFYHLTRAARPLFRPCWSMELSGAVDDIPRQGPAIVAPNHSCFVDPWFVGPFLFPRPIRFLITRNWYDKSWLSRAIFRAYGTIPMEEDPKATMDATCTALAAGEVVGIFPEGRISYDGTIQRFRTGVCYVAARSGAPVIPVGIRGAFESLPRTRRIPRPGRVTVTVGPPMTFPGSPLPGAPPRRDVRAFRDRLFREVCRLSGQDSRVAARAGTAAVRGVVLDAGERGMSTPDPRL